MWNSKIVDYELRQMHHARGYIGGSTTGSAKSPGYNVANEDYFLGAAEKSPVTSTHKTPLKTRALKEAPVLGEKVCFLFVEAGTSCGGPVGTFKRKVCMKERQA